MKKVKLYDTTLRDGAQSEGISFSVQDKLKIACKLDELGIHYIEGGWPGSNPKDLEFFKKAKRLKLINAKITAFGSTRRAKSRAEKDANIKAVIETGTPAVAIVGKSWALHVQAVLKTSLNENLKMIKDSIRFLKSRGLEVIYDAEHFFDGYRENARYALRTLQVAEETGADVLVLCDTNGGFVTSQLASVIKKVKGKIKTPLGIHAHNDAGMAVANSIAAVEAGCIHVQGTINGYGERCGNADLCSVIPNLELKLGIEGIPAKKLHQITEVSRFVSEVSNMIPQDSRPFVGNSAFAHKGGIHVDAVMKDSRTYEHVNPEVVGNRRRFLISELSGGATIMLKAKEYKLDLEKKSPQTKKILESVQNLEHKGYEFEAADGSFELLVRKIKGEHHRFFDLEGFRVTVEKRGRKLVSEATIKIRVKSVQEHTAAEGDGPVNALDNALRKALGGFYPTLREMHLIDFKVRILDAKAGTAAKTRVLLQCRDMRDEWTTVGVSENIIEASWQALVDSVEYKLLKDERTGRKEKS